MPARRQNYVPRFLRFDAAEHVPHRRHFVEGSGWGAAGGDTTPPTTSITSPANGATVSGTVTVTASGTDNVGVTKLELYWMARWP